MDLRPEHYKLIEILSLTGLIGFVVGVAKHVVIVRHGSWWNFCMGLIAFVLVAIFVGLLLEDTNFSLTTKTAMIGICAYVAEDILDVLRNLVVAFRNDPKGFIKEGLDMWRGRRP